MTNQFHSLYKLLPSKCEPKNSLRKQKTFIRPEKQKDVRIGLF